MTVPEIIVVGRNQATKLLFQEEGRRFRHVISIGHLSGGLVGDGRPPAGLRQHCARKLRLLFHDCERDYPENGYYAATREDAAKVARFAVGCDGPLLVHCSKGYSRSTAATFIILCVMLGPGREQEAMDRLVEIKGGGAPGMYASQLDDYLEPNRALVWWGDLELGRRGAMAEVHRQRFKRVSEDHLPRLVVGLCGKYLGDNDATCPQLTCIRKAGHSGLCDNVNGEDDAKVC